MNEPARASACELLAGFQAGAFSPSEALDALARRIESVEPVVKAFATLVLDRASDEAEAATARWRAGTQRPLEGVPFAAKDLFDTGGVGTAYGSPMFSSHVPGADADAVRRLRGAGAILIGKTTTHEFAWGMTGCNRHFGTGRNPWSPRHVTGGSSAGSAAALAADEVPLALGSDTGGSIRIPAAYCGVAGLKPTYGLVDTTGVFPLGPSLDHAGPMARTPGDLRLALSVLAPPAAPATARDLRGLRVGVCAVVAGVEPTALVRKAVEDAAGVMAALGCVTMDVVFEHADVARRAFAVIQQAEALAVHRRAGLWPSRRDEYGDDVRGRLEGAESVTLDDQVAAGIEREHLRVRLDRLFDTVDLLLLPVSPSPPAEWGLEDLDHLGERRLIRDIVLPVTSPLNLVGVPACAVRGGFDDLGVPIGLQLVGTRGSDARVLAAAGAFYDATPDVQARRPELSAV